MKEKILQLVNQVTILNESLYRKAAVTIPLIEKNGEHFILFEKRAKNIAQGGEISFPGGKYDIKDKTLQDTAIRETCEELNISLNNITLIGSIGSIVTRINFLIEVFPIFIKDIKFEELNFNRDEVEKIYQIPLSYFIKTKPLIYHVTSKYELESTKFKTLNIPKKYKDRWKETKGKIYVYNYADDILIWGVTAEIIFNFVDLMDI